MREGVAGFKLTRYVRIARRALTVAIAAGLLGMAVGAGGSHAADVELGRYLSSECMTCHGVARPDDTIPNIFGMAETTFAEVVKAYREKHLNNEVMQTVASRLNDEDIAALAAYFAATESSR